MLKKIFLPLFSYNFSRKRSSKQHPPNEGGYALLALILTLAILGIYLTSSVVPNFQLSAQREKEAELYYRGQQMAEGIARWYNNGRLTGPVRLTFPPAYGYLKELEKLKEGVTINLNEVKFVRASATRDPFDGGEWEPVYARDPRIMPILQAWAGQTGGIIPNELMLIAGPPVKLKTIAPTTPATPPAGGATRPGSATQSGRGAPPPDTRTDDRDDDDDDDDDDLGDTVNDPLAHLFSSSNNKGLPIVGVATRRKGQAVRPYYGLQNYEEWVFIYIPPDNRFAAPQQNQNQNRQPQPPNRVSQ